MPNKAGRKKGCIPWNKGKKCPWAKNNPQIFKKGIHPLTEFKKGQHASPETEFKKGQNVGSNHPNWKGGRFIEYRGYVMIYKPEHPFCKNNGQVYEHRLVIEQHLGRYLKPEEEGHHLGVKDDNRPHRLMGFISHSAHKRFEKNPDNVKPSEIIFDGRKLKS
jgi:hypothetical protein